jgi:hypothetical protein
LSTDTAWDWPRTDWLVSVDPTALNNSAGSEEQVDTCLWLTASLTTQFLRKYFAVVERCCNEGLSDCGRLRIAVQRQQLSVRPFVRLYVSLTRLQRCALCRSLSLCTGRKESILGQESERELPDTFMAVRTCGRRHIINNV